MRAFDNHYSILLCLFATACSGNGGGALPTGQASSGGSSSGGGPASTAAGGNVGTQSTVATGGTTSSGGGNTSTTTAPSSGAMGPGSGGNANVGGASSGGVVNGGNANGGANVGGVATGGGSSASGGKATGGSAALGGAGGLTTGGATSTGGTSLGGNAGRGGAATGGTTTLGGTTAIGGAGKGGTTSTGGSPPTGGTSGSTGPAYIPAFIIGADISRVQEHEVSGRTFKDVDGTTPAGTTTTGGGILTILKNHGFNYIRLRLFVNPAASGGYSSAGYCDLAHTVRFAAGVKLAGMGLLLDFHYSDTWADPGNQNKPAAWANLSFADLTTQVYNHTKDAITQLKAGNGRPDMVQIGNEIPQGLLFDASGAIAGTGGKVSGQQFGNLATLLGAGVRGVKEVDANIKIVMHLDRCNDLATNTWWVTGVQGQGVQFDILGESCYDRANYQQPATAWAPTFSGLATSYPNLQFIAAEYSDSKQLVNDTIYNIPNQRGLGTFIWEPTNWGEMMFNSSGQLLAQYATIFDNIAATYGKR